MTISENNKTLRYRKNNHLKNWHNKCVSVLSDKEKDWLVKEYKADLENVQELISRYLKELQSFVSLNLPNKKVRSKLAKDNKLIAKLSKNLEKQRKKYLPLLGNVYLK